MSWFISIGERFGRWALILAYLVVIPLAWLLVAERGTGTTLGTELGAQDALRTVQNYRNAASALLAGIGVSAGIGLLGAALIEVLKRLTGLRGAFQRHEIARYLEAANTEEPTKASRQLEQALGMVWFSQEELNDEPTDRAGRVLKAHARRHPRYFYNLPLEQLMGQVAAAADSALTRPLKSYDLLQALTGEDLRTAIDALREADLLASKGAAERTTKWEGISIQRGNSGYHDLQAVVLERIHRTIDAMQVIIGHRWRWLIRSLAALVCGVGAAFVVATTGVTGGNAAVLWFLAAVPGTFFSWFTRDLVASVERFRT